MAIINHNRSTFNMSRTFTIDFATSSKGVITEDRELTDSEIAASSDGTDTQKRIKREDRNNLLAETDWTQMPDVPEATKTKWAAYRQELRDLPSKSEFPDVDFPTKPS